MATSSPFDVSKRSVFMSLGLREANRIADAAIHEAEIRGMAVSVSLCDPRGRLISHQRMDNVPPEASRGSIGKAIAAVGLGHATGTSPIELTEYGQVGEVLAEGVPVVNRKGGLPIFRMADLVGAIGVSGAPNNELDEQCARAAISAVKLSPNRI
jgi:uncharacterized protein GlcG (DUF336 family)